MHSEYHGTSHILRSTKDEIIYRARCPTNNTSVIVKEIKLSSLDPIDQDGVLETYKALLHITHQNIIKVRKFWIDKPAGKLCVELEDYAPELSEQRIAQHLQQQDQLEEHLILKLASDIAGGLAHFHSKFNGVEPLVYGGISPENIIIKSDGTYQLSDCINIRVQSSLHTNEIKTATITDSSNISEELDVRSFGFLLLRLCKGETSFSNQSNFHSDQQLDLPGYSAELSTIISRCLTSNLREIPSAADLSLYLLRMRALHTSDATKTHIGESVSESESSNMMKFLFGFRYKTHSLSNMVQLMPRTGIDVDSPTQLMLAAEAGDANKVEQNIEQVGMIDWQGTALLKAARKGHVECVSALLSELGIQSRRGWTALQDAAYCGQKKCIPLLLLEACIQRPDGQTALMGAAANGHQDCVKLLCDKELRLTTTVGRTALMFAAENNHPQCIQILLSEAGMQDIMGTTALMLAALAGNVECVRKLALYEAILCNNEDKTAVDLLEEKLRYTTEPLLERLSKCMQILLLNSEEDGL